MLAWEAHLQDHNKDAIIVLARVRKQAWVIRGRYAVKAAISACMYCRRTTSTTAQQLMAELPEFTLEQSDPFKVCSLDMFGPLMAKGVGGHARKTFKVWGVLYSCLVSKAVSIWAIPGYDADSFWLAHQRQMAV